MTEKLICEHAFMYRFYEGKVECFEGAIFKYEDDRRTACKFHADNGKMYTVSVNQGVVNGHNVWLEDDDELKARRQLYNHYANRRRELQLEERTVVHALRVIKEGLF